MSRRKPRFRLWIWVSLAALIVLLTAGIRHSRGALQSVRQPDGTIVRLEAVANGPQYRFSPGGPLQQLFGAMLPPNFGAPLGFGAVTRPDVGPADPVAWITTPKMPTDGRPSASFERWSVVDSYGGERSADSLVAYHGNRGNRGVLSLALYRFPRRQSHVRLRRYSPPIDPKWRPVAELEVPNPYPGPHPQWSGSRPPLTVREPDLTCTLKAFTSGASRDDLRKPTNEGRVFGTYSAVEVDTRNSAGAPSAWQPVDLAFLDATGNNYDRRGFGGTEHQGAIARLWAPNTLPSDEAAWKVRIELARPHTVTFSPEETWTVNEIAVPSRRDVTSINQTIVKEGIKIQLYALDYELGEPGLRARLYTGEPGIRLTLLKVIDEKGRSLPLTPFDDRIIRRTKHGWSDYTYYLPLRGGEKKLKATFAVQKSRFVEFLAAPTHLTPPPQRQGSR